MQPVWSSGNKGEGVLVAVVDSAIQIFHPDLTQNSAGVPSINYVTGGTDPGPGTIPTQTDGTGGCSDSHGTEVAGVIAARDSNAIGGSGVSPRVKIAGLNALAVSDTSTAARAMTDLLSQGVAVVNNSWGQPDGSGGRASSYAAAPQVWKDAILTGTGTQRSGSGQGLGVVYLFAAGNGAVDTDNSNQDGFANFRNVLAIGAVDQNGQGTNYSEPGANVLVAGYSGGASTPGLTTTDISGASGASNGSSGNANYVSSFSGTSASTPTVAGVVALMLHARPALGWRDVRWILAKTARQAVARSGNANDTLGASDINTHGYAHSVGFGIVDAQAAVTEAGSHTLLPALQTCSTSLMSPGTAIPDNGATVDSDMTVSGCGLTRIEFVEIEFSSNHTYAGDLQIDLMSPSGRISQLGTQHLCTTSVTCPLPSGSWTFGSVRHLGESVINGNWRLSVRDRISSDTGNLTSWRLVFYGH